MEEGKNLIATTSDVESGDSSTIHEYVSFILKFMRELISVRLKFDYDIHLFTPLSLFT